jgi:LacI family transcriptional regulator
MSISIKRMAQDLKLAVSTVSKALRDSHEISEETKRMVLDYARKVNYIPNPYAGSLTNRTTKNIAVVLPEVADTFFSNAINGIDSVAQARGYHVMVYLTHEQHLREMSILRELRSGRVDGVLISVAAGDGRDISVFNVLCDELPLIFFDRVCEGVNAAQVLTDDFESAYHATRHLLLKGCSEPVLIAPAGELSIIHSRKKGFAAALAEHGIRWDERFFYRCADDQDGSLHSVTALFERHPRVDGVVASVEKVAMQVYAVARERNIVIPRDLKVIAFSNLQIASLLDPPLSTIEQPAFEMGRVAATLLFDALIKKRDVRNERIIIPSVLRERASTAETYI